MKTLARIAENSLEVLGKEAKLIETTRPRTEELPETATPETPTALDVLGKATGNGVGSAPSNRRRARVSREDSVGVGPVAIEETAPGSGDSRESVESNGVAKPDRESRRESRQMARAEKRQRPPAEFAAKIAAPRDSATAAVAISIDGSGNTSNDETHTRALAEQEDGALADAGAGHDAVLGGLHHHAKVMMMQLETAENLIGRVAAERNDFRQQLADLQGIPVEAIPMTPLDQIRNRPSKALAGQSVDEFGSPVDGIAVASPKRTRARRSRETDPDELDEPTPPSVMTRLNYFSVEDVALARKRRQMLVLVLLLVVGALWMVSRMGIWQMPSNLSKDSLSQLPVVGELMSYFLAGWVMYRIVRVGSRGVKWIFPTEDKKHKRR